MRPWLLCELCIIAICLKSQSLSEIVGVVFELMLVTLPGFVHVKYLYCSSQHCESKFVFGNIVLAGTLYIYMWQRLSC